MNNYRLYKFRKNIIQKIALFSGFHFFRKDLFINRHLIIPKIIFIFILLSGLISSIGCEAFVRKFTRKPKKDKVKEEPVLAPEDYSLSNISSEERYRQYFLFWKSWQDELITALSSSGSYKKTKICLKEAIKNLEEIESLLFEEKQKELAVYLERLHQLENEIKHDIYGTRLVSHQSETERLKRDILRDFSYPKVKNHLR